MTSSGVGKSCAARAISYSRPCDGSDFASVGATEMPGRRRSKKAGSHGSSRSSIRRAARPRAATSSGVNALSARKGTSPAWIARARSAAASRARRANAS
ncbi:hypothetical protein [Actinomadura madurae]|uniref:hypothetical protein n=1 Tax=Actinomadura madurae TaxID=1993 RepID=UPI0020D21D6F|nr:hypothetical protein [Actinomadura madurae]MCQ0010403.1 hypothetical protein [Actinomadura madurae]